MVGNHKSRAGVNRLSLKGVSYMLAEGIKSCGPFCGVGRVAGGPRL